MRHVIIWLFLLSSCTVTEKQVCNEACELKQEVATLQMQKRAQREQIRALITKVQRFEQKRDSLCEECICRKHEFSLDDCHPMGTDGEWNVAIKGGFPGEGVIPYMCTHMTGSPINKYPPAFRKLWHAKANNCILNVQNLLDDPSGRLAYRIDGVRANISWELPRDKVKWKPKQIRKQTH